MNAFDLHTGDKIEFVLEKEGAITLRPIKKSVDDVFGRLCWIQGMSSRSRV